MREMEETGLTVDETVLRRCTLEDAQTLALVGAATFLDAFAGTLPGRSIVEHCRKHHTAENYARYLSEAECRIWIAETVAMEGAVGYCMVTRPDLPIDNPRPSDLELKRIYLLSRFHGSGAGRDLIGAAIEGAREMGAERLYLGVYAKNARALRFYERVGFRVVGTRRFQMGFNVFDDLVLNLEL